MGIVDKLIRAGANINIRDKVNISAVVYWFVCPPHGLTLGCIQNGDTPLHDACSRSKGDIAEMLISEGADTSIQNKVSLSDTTTAV
jgi:ankyrin repeat protein